MTAVYGWVIGRLLRVAAIVGIVYCGLLFTTWWGVTYAPKGFLPTQDQGYLLVNVQLPDSASVQRTEAIVYEARQDRPQHARRGAHRWHLRHVVPPVDERF